MKPNDAAKKTLGLSIVLLFGIVASIWGGQLLSHPVEEIAAAQGSGTTVYLPLVFRNWPPQITSISTPDPWGRYTVSWSGSELNSGHYTLAYDEDQSFSSPTTVYSGPLTSTQVTHSPAGLRYYRLQVTDDSGTTWPWSNAHAVLWGFDPFSYYPDFAWDVWVKEPGKDGTMTYENGQLVFTITDNTATFLATPGWQNSEHFRVEVDARFENPWWANALGLVFDMSDDWQEYYVFMLASNSQPFWTLQRFNRDGTKYCLRDPGSSHCFIGTDPYFVNGEEEWNRLIVERNGSWIHVYINGYDEAHEMSGSPFYDPYYSAGRSNRLVGVFASSFEGESGQAIFDNFLYTPLDTP